MTNENVRKDDKPKAQEFLGGMWDNTAAFQRQWLNMWTQPFAETAPMDQMWDQWRAMGNEWLDHAARGTELMNSFVDDEFKLGREFTDKAMGMVRNLNKDEPKDVTPELAREWFDVSRRCTERAFKFGNASVKVAEDLGLKVSEKMMKIPLGAK